jgi:hypothetical protein
LLILGVIVVRWDLRGRWWFWTFLIAIAGLHVPLMMLTAEQISRISDGFMFFPIIADGAAILAAIRIVERRVGAKALPLASDNEGSGSRV